MYVCMCVCMNVCMYVCVYECMYVFITHTYAASRAKLSRKWRRFLEPVRPDLFRDVDVSRLKNGENSQGGQGMGETNENGGSDQNLGCMEAGDGRERGGGEGGSRGPLRSKRNKEKEILAFRKQAPQRYVYIYCVCVWGGVVCMHNAPQVSRHVAVYTWIIIKDTYLCA